MLEPATERVLTVLVEAMVPMVTIVSLTVILTLVEAERASRFVVRKDVGSSLSPVLVEKGEAVPIKSIILDEKVLH